jgi:hypothetical protein
MARKRREKRTGTPTAPQSEPDFIQAFEAEYARLLRDKGLEAAKAFFRENFMVRCFACGYMGKTAPPLNCARCGTYLDGPTGNEKKGREQTHQTPGGADSVPGDHPAHIRSGEGGEINQLWRSGKETDINKLPR